jgi:hypothetical protein
MAVEGHYALRLIGDGWDGGDGWWRAMLFQAGSGHIGQLEFGFFGSSGDAAALGNVFVTTARGLHHLIMGAGPPVNEAVAEADGGIVDDLSLGVRFFALLFALVHQFTIASP